MKAIKLHFPLLYYLGIFLLVLLLTSSFQFIVTSGASMEPTYYSGDLLLKIFPYREPQVGDVVVIRHQDKLMVKRVAATAGDPASVPNIPHANDSEPAHDRGYWIFAGQEGNDLPDYWASHATEETSWNHYFYFNCTDNCDSAVCSASCIVPEGYIFVVGDNLDLSYDSRDPEFGLISLDQVEGYILCTVLKADRDLDNAKPEIHIGS